MDIWTKIKGEKKYIPEMKHEGDACFDCKACLEEKIVIKSGERTKVSLGFAMQLPKAYEALIRPRSGLSSKGIDVCLGTIDSNYRGTVMANVVNNSGVDFVVEDGDRICQLAIRKVPSVILYSVDELDSTDRGSDGFGSTGIK